jgi:hypothetical protein
LPFTDFLPGLFRKADPEPTPPATVTLTDPLASWFFGAQPTYSNISVTPKTAMQVLAVALAVQTIANAVGGLSIKLYVRNGKGREADPAHPAFTLGMTRPIPGPAPPSCAPSSPAMPCCMTMAVSRWPCAAAAATWSSSTGWTRPPSK